MAAVGFSGGHLTWNGDQFLQQIRASTVRHLYTAANTLRARIQRNISASGRSQPGAYPGTDTGTLRKSIIVDVDEVNNSFTVGTNLPYGMFLEYGTQGGRVLIAAPGKTFSWVNAQGERVFAKKITLGPIKERSFLRRTYYEELADITAILTRTI